MRCGPASDHFLWVWWRVDWFWLSEIFHDWTGITGLKGLLIKTQLMKIEFVVELTIRTRNFVLHLKLIIQYKE